MSSRVAATSAWSDLEEQARLGRPRRCVEIALEWAARDPEEAAGIARALDEALSSMFVTAAFRGHMRSEHDDINRLFADAGRSTARVGSWWSYAEPPIGRAAFPVAIGREGTVRFVRVGTTAGFAPRDERFERALGDARRMAESMFGAIGDVRIAIVPDLPANERLEGPSVGLAALVALASHALRRPVRDDVAFTGVLPHVAGRIEAVEADTLPSKLEGLRQWPSIRALQCPGAARGVGACDSIACIGDHDDVWAALAQAFGCTEALLRSLSPTVHAPARDRELELRVRALLEAAGGPLSIVELSDALYAWDPECVAGAALRDVLSKLVAEGLCSPSGTDRYAAGPEASPERLPAAHCALSRTTHDEAARAIHLAGAREHHSAHEALRSVLAHAGADAIARVLAALERIESIVGRAGSDDACRALGVDGAAALVRVAWHARRDEPALVDQLRRCRDGVDRLLWVQAAVERLLGALVAIVLVDLGRSAPSPAVAADLRELTERPSIGRMAALCDHAASEPSLPEETRALLRRVWRAPGGDVVGPLNDALHHFGAWNALARPDGEGRATEHAHAIAARLLGRAEAYYDGAQRPAAQGQAFVVRTDTRVLHYRGVVRDLPGDAGARARYFDFDTGEVHHGSSGSPFSPPQDLRSHRPREVERRRADVGALPLPLAHAVVGLRREGAGPVELLDALDLGVAFLLRAIAWPLVVDRMEPRALPTEERQWLGRGTKRNLFRLVCAPGTDASGPAGRLASWLTQRRELVWDLIEVLEHAGHAPPPLAEARNRLRARGDLLEHLLSDAPFARGGIALVGRSLGSYGLSLAGTAPRCMPSCPQALRPGEVAWIDERGDLATLGPFAVAVERRHHHSLFWLRDTRRSQRKRLWEHEPSFVSTSVRGELRVVAGVWRHDGGAPLQTAIDDATAGALGELR